MGGILLDRGLRAVIVIGLVSLVVAVICFRLLESAASFDNSGWSLGGAIAGFIASVLVLDRVRERADRGLISGSQRRNSAFVVREVAKVLDLRPGYGKTVDPSRAGYATLTDYYSLEKGAIRRSTMTFHYATTGRQIEGVSLSHPESHTWREKPHPHELGTDKHLKKEYELELVLDHLAEGESAQVINALTYRDAFEGETKEWLHTHIDYPTAYLVMIVLFPEDRPCTRASGFVKGGREPMAECREAPPVRMECGKVVYWRIEAPVQGYVYQLEWEWQARRTHLEETQHGAMERI
ncbi:MAG: hypothetical protein M3198_14970 [Actinomycetota bacterium]|nr:hypothetical protein [Actinomycetota bacterium]